MRLARGRVLRSIKHANAADIAIFACASATANLRDWGDDNHPAERVTPMNVFRPTMIAAAVLGATLAPAFAADPIGTWLTEEGKATVRVAYCGGALCGTIVALKEPNDPQTGKPKIDKNNADGGMRGRPI